MADPDLLDDETVLIERMTRPSDLVREAMEALEGDVLILGVGGKMGPTLAELLVRGGATANSRRVMGEIAFFGVSVWYNLPR